jgi:hypothetical protein
VTLSTGPVLEKCSQGWYIGQVGTNRYAVNLRLSHRLYFCPFMLPALLLVSLVSVRVGRIHPNDLSAFRVLEGQQTDITNLGLQGIMQVNGN